MRHIFGSPPQDKSLILLTSLTKRKDAKILELLKSKRHQSIHQNVNKDADEGQEHTEREVFTQRWLSRYAGGGVSHPLQLTTGLVVNSFIITNPTLAGERMLLIPKVSILSEQIINYCIVRNSMASQTLPKSSTDQVV